MVLALGSLDKLNFRPGDPPTHGIRCRSQLSRRSQTLAIKAIDTQDQLPGISEKLFGNDGAIDGAIHGKGL